MSQCRGIPVINPSSSPLSIVKGHKSCTLRQSILAVNGKRSGSIWFNTHFEIDVSSQKWMNNTVEIIIFLHKECVFWVLTPCLRLLTVYYIYIDIVQPRFQLFAPIPTWLIMINIPYLHDISIHFPVHHISSTCFFWKISRNLLVSLGDFPMVNPPMSHGHGSPPPRYWAFAGATNRETQTQAPWPRRCVLRMGCGEQKWFMNVDEP